MMSYIFRNPNKYGQNNALQYNFAMNILSKLSFDGKARVLDIGCGDGLITNEMASIVREGCVIGTDISTEMIQHASKVYLKNNLGFLQMDASKNIFREQFDIITSFNCLHWIKDQQEVLIGINKAAVSGAQIALLLSHKKSLYHLVLDFLCSSEKWKGYFIDYISPRLFFDPAEYEEMIIKSALEIIEFSEEEMTYTFKSKEHLKEFFNAAGSQVKMIPDLRKNEFLNDFVSEYLNQCEWPDEYLIPVSFWCLQIILSKPNLANQSRNT